MFRCHFSNFSSTLIAAKHCAVAFLCLLATLSPFQEKDGSRTAVSSSIAQDSEPSNPAHNTDNISAELLEQFRTKISPLLESHCMQCHGAEEENGSVRFDTPEPRFDSSVNVGHWQHSYRALLTQEMPPEDESSLSDEDRKLMLDWLKEALEQAATARRRNQGQSRIRRLSKRELNHTLQDFFEVPASFTNRIPDDPRSTEGYDTAKKMLMVSRSDLQGYLTRSSIALIGSVAFLTRRRISFSTSPIASSELSRMKSARWTA